MIDSKSNIKSALETHIQALLVRAPALTAAQLSASTQASQPSISRALNRLGARICRMGAARNTRYAWVQEVMGLPGRAQLLWLGGAAHRARFGELCFLAGNQIYVRGDGVETLMQGHLPWYLTSLQPQGFLGRELARTRPDLPSDPQQWSLPQVLYAALSGLHDPPGAIRLAEEGLGGGFSSSGGWIAPLDVLERAQHYDTLATQIGHSLPARSSAGGEQPKFTARVEGMGDVIVKFTPPRDTPFGERWFGLLQLEQLALGLLRTHGFATAQTELLHGPQRTHLQSLRFDRGETMLRRHVVAIDALHGEFVGGARHHWVHTCEALAEKKLISQQDLSTAATLHAFGHFIANTDMHFGNLSFFVDDIAKPQLRLAPLYDMLPMKWRPGVHDGVLNADPVQEQPLPIGYAHEHARAREIAVQFWEQAAGLDTLPAALRTGARRSARRVQSNFRDGV